LRLAARPEPSRGSQGGEYKAGDCGAESSEHPPLYDGGPNYLVMEFIEGTPLKTADAL
jgi:hypothetical protein